MMYTISDLQYDPEDNAYHIESMFHGYCVWKAEDDKGYYIKLRSEFDVIHDIPCLIEYGLYSWEWYRSDLLKALALINYLESNHFETVITKVNFN